MREASRDSPEVWRSRGTTRVQHMTSESCFSPQLTSGPLHTCDTEPLRGQCRLLMEKTGDLWQQADTNNNHMAILIIWPKEKASDKIEQECSSTRHSQGRSLCKWILIDRLSLTSVPNIVSNIRTHLSLLTLHPASLSFYCIILNLTSLTFICLVFVCSLH